MITTYVEVTVYSLNLATCVLNIALRREILLHRLERDAKLNHISTSLPSSVIYFQFDFVLVCYHGTAGGIVVVQVWFTPARGTAKSAKPY